MTPDNNDTLRCVVTGLSIGKALAWGIGTLNEWALLSPWGVGRTAACAASALL